MDRIKKYIAEAREIEAAVTITPQEYNLTHGNGGMELSDDQRLFINRALNHHARLLDALEEAVKAIELHKKEWGGSYPETADVRLYSVLPRIAAILEGEKCR